MVMSKQGAILMSIHPKWLWKAMGGEKTIEVRKTMPGIEPPFTVYLYCTKGGDELWTEDKCGILPRSSFGSWKMNGTVCAEFVCDKIYQIVVKRREGLILMDGEKEFPFTNDKGSCLSKQGVYEYLKGKTGYGLHITNLRTYKKPLSVNDFCLRGRADRVTRPPQSWCYVEEIDEEEAANGKQDKD